jgi:hypothetical protein
VVVHWGRRSSTTAGPEGSGQRVWDSAPKEIFDADTVALPPWGHGVVFSFDLEPEPSNARFGHEIFCRFAAAFGVVLDDLSSAGPTAALAA